MYCKSCNVKVETHTNVCPLCKRNLIEDDTFKIYECLDLQDECSRELDILISEEQQNDNG